MGNNKNARARHHFEQEERAQLADEKREERLVRSRAKRARKRAKREGIPEGEQEEGQ